MSKTFKQILTVTVTPTAGDASTYTGNQAYQFKNAYEAGNQIIKVDEGNGTIHYFNRDCICSVLAERTQGDAYDKPDCEGLYCPDPVVKP